MTLADNDPAGLGQRGAVLRRECLYASHISEWRKSAQAGVVSALGS
ncbi:MAG: hypothetical protein V9E81_15085 [Marmoricola sp.]